ncbi:hypothetical protein FACS18949_08950 [Clostridia bacterium]|nr:hypothetical protein FACS189425_11150 [Clostridia bacterium]GHV33894.1 hypothetical protein FACS18949_08950 [Clostridia bacterium]
MPTIDFWFQQVTYGTYPNVTTYWEFSPALVDLCHLIIIIGVVVMACSVLKLLLSCFGGGRH